MLGDDVVPETTRRRAARGGNAIVKGISAHLPCGGITAICGPNGAGKSALMAAIANSCAAQG